MTSTKPGPTSLTAAPRSARWFTSPAAVFPAVTRRTAPTRPMPPSATLTATSGSSRRSRRGCPAGNGRTNHIRRRRGMTSAPTYAGSGDPALHRTDYSPVWLDNLADDVTLEASAMDGAAQGPDAVRSIILAVKSLYPYQ